MLSAGLIDLQVNGFAGIDFNSGTLQPDEVDQALEAMLATGVTACLPTIISAPADELMARFTALDAAISASRLGPPMCIGYHLEGPFLNPAEGYVGCHPPDAMIPGDVTLVDRLEAGLDRPILLVTVAPERPGVLDLVKPLTRSGRVVALGHTAVNCDQAARAAELGATLSTHLGNGVPQMAHKFHNAIFAQVAEDHLWASFIADGIHIPPKALKTLLRAKGLARAVLVTDAVAAAKAPPGRYRLGRAAIERRGDGSVRLAGTELLAGSSLCLDAAVRNVVAWGLATPDEAIAMASRHARAILEPTLRTRGLSLSRSEVAWSDDLEVRRVSVGPVERLYTAEPSPIPQHGAD